MKEVKEVMGVVVGKKSIGEVKMAKSERWHLVHKLEELEYQIERIEKEYKRRMEKELKPLKRKFKRLEGQINRGLRFCKLKDPCPTCNGTGRIVKNTGCPDYLDFDDVVEEPCPDCEE